MTTIVLDPLKRWMFGDPKDSKQRAPSPQLPKDAPEGVHEAHRQACFLMHHSPRASGALARYSLQKIVRDFWKLAPREQGTLASEFDLIGDRITEEASASIESVRRFGSIESQLSQDRDMMVETTIEEAKVLIALLQVLTQEWYEDRRKRQAHLDVIQAMTGKPGIGPEQQAGGLVSGLRKEAPGMEEQGARLEPHPDETKKSPEAASGASSLQDTKQENG